MIAALDHRVRQVTAFGAEHIGGHARVFELWQLHRIVG